MCASAVARHVGKRRTLLRLLVQTGRLQRGEETLGQRTELLDGRRVENEIGVGGSKHRGDVVLRGLHAPVDVDGLQNDARVHDGPVRFRSPLTDRDLEFSERERGFLLRLLRGVLELRAGLHSKHILGDSSRGVHEDNLGSRHGAAYAVVDRRRYLRHERLCALLRAIFLHDDDAVHFIRHDFRIRV